MRSLKVCFVLACFGCQGLAFAQNEKQLALVIARPTAVRFVEDLPDLDVGEDTLFVGDLYKVRLREIRLIVGDVEFKSPIEVQLIATHRVYLEVEEIFVVLELGDTVRALTWGQPTQVACVPPDMAQLLSPTGLFGAYTRSDGQKCTWLE